MLLAPTLPPSTMDIAYELQIGPKQPSYDIAIATPQQPKKWVGAQETGFDVRIIKTAAISRHDVINELHKLTLLQKNWDGYDAERICIACIQNAVSIISSLPTHVPSPDIFPNPNGTVTLEWETKTGIFSIEVGENSYSSFIEYAGSSHYDQGKFSRGLPALAEAALQTLYPEPTQSLSIISNKELDSYGRHGLSAGLYIGL